MPGNQIFFHDHKVLRLGFGCWQIAGDYAIGGKPNGYGAADIKECIRAIHIAIESGICFFDTAAGYGHGKSEEILGEAVKSYRGIRHNILMCTKFAYVNGGTNAGAMDYTANNMVASVEGSLKRLHIDCLGTILLHNPPDDFNYKEYDTHPYEKLIKEGKILSYGVSCRSHKGVANVLNEKFGSVIEAIYNPLDRRLEHFFSNKEYIDKYLFICRVPLASGFINSRTLTQDITFPTNDIRSTFSKEQTDWVTAAVRKLSFLHELEGGITISALRFQLSNPYNTIAIPGMRNTRQVSDVIKALQLGPLPVNIMDEIVGAVPDVFYAWK